MSKRRSNKVPSLQSAIERLVCAIGPERVAVVDDPSEDPEPVTVASRADPAHAVVVSVAGIPEGRYAVWWTDRRTEPRRAAFIAVHQAMTNAGLPPRPLFAPPNDVE